MKKFLSQALFYIGLLIIGVIAAPLFAIFPREESIEDPDQSP